MLRGKGVFFMRRSLAFLLVLALLLLPGCGPKAQKADGPLTLNPDGTLGNLRWGMRYAEAFHADSRIIPGTGGDPNLESCTVEFLGKQWTLTLVFGASAHMSGHVRDGVRRLTRLELSPLEGGSWEELVEPLEAVLGPRNITARYVSPTWDEEGNFSCLTRERIPQWAWAWTSGETMGDLLTEKELAAAYPYAEDLNASRFGTPLFTLYFQYWDAVGHWTYSYRNMHPEYIPAAPESELPEIVIDGGNAVEAGILAQLLRVEEVERPPLSPGADLDSARLYWQGEEYRFTGETVYELPGVIKGHTGDHDLFYAEAILVGAVKGSGTREELTGNLDGYVYMEPDLLFPLYFRWRDWDEAADGPVPYYLFSILKGS